IGLAPYGEEDVSIFFGRIEEIRVVSANLRASRLTILFGESGVGKSSLLQAGLLRQLHQKAERDRGEFGLPRFPAILWKVWNNDPIEGLSVAIQTAARVSANDTVSEDLAAGIKRWVRAMERAQLEGKFLVILDQFEEFFEYRRRGVVA